VTERFHGTAVRENRWWLVEVAGIGATQSRTLAGAREAAVGLVSAVRDIDADHVNVSIAPRLGRTLEKQLVRAREAVEALDHQQREAAALSRQVARDLKAAGMSGADTATIMGISPQRVSQLVNS
jgi:predicted XRE-type DNA-binding protein